MIELIPAVKLENVSMYYNSNNNINVGINGISLEFYKGEFVAVTGESGSGKTSLINVIGASLGYHSGELYYFGEPSSHFDDEERESFRRDHIGYVCQNYNLIDSYTVLQNVVASMIIGGSDLPEKTLKEKALSYLDKVGIKDIARSKASKISSGQKQRLAIARALAKETDIILADEPTGNLDIENGREIVSLLKKLSADHLVIMVTHNIEEARDSVSRIIRLSDGHVVSDIDVAPSEKSECSASVNKKPKESKTAWTFSNFNRFARPKRTVFLSIFILIISIACFVFLGMIISNLDDTLVREYNNSAFINPDMNRIVIIKRDKNDPTAKCSFDDSDVEKISKLKYVMEADKYDLANEVNYYVVEDGDVEFRFTEEFVYNGPEKIDESRNVLVNPVFNNNDRYVKSSTCVSKDRLIKGKFPEEVNEILVVGSEDMIGKEIVIAFKTRFIWGLVDYYSQKMKIVGVVRANPYGDRNQVYFSEAFCRELVYNYSLSYRCIFHLEVDENDFLTPLWGYAFVDDVDSKGEAVLVSNDFFSTADIYYGYADGRSLVTSSNKLVQPDPYSSLVTRSKIILKIIGYREYMSRSFIKIDKTLYDDFFGEVESNQMSVYIEDYAYMDEVLSEINAIEEYEALSVYRASAIKYDEEKVISRNVTIGICSFALVIIAVLTMFVLGAFLSLNKNDYFMLRQLGMNKKTMYLTNYFEILSATVVFYFVALIISLALDAFKVDFVHSVMKYLSWYHYAVIFAVVMLIAYLTVSRFNAGLQKQTVKRR